MAPTNCHNVSIPNRTIPWIALHSHLVLGIRLEEFAVKVCSDDDPPGRFRILRRNDIREGLDSIWSLVRKRVLFYMPVELLHHVNNIVPDLGVVHAVRCSGG